MMSRAGEAVANIIAAGIVPAGLEMMDQLATRAVEQFVHAGYPLDAAAILLCELDGTREEVETEIAKVAEVMRASGATDLRVSRDEAERLKLWSGRKAAFPAVGRLKPDYYCMDGTIPRKNLPRVLRSIAELSERYGLPRRNVFHAGDGNLHPLIMFDANVPGQLETAEDIRRADSRAVHLSRRYHYGRARGRGGEDRPDVRAVPTCRARELPRDQTRVRRAATQPRQGCARRCTAALSSAPCTSIRQAALPRAGTLLMRRDEGRRPVRGTAGAGTRRTRRRHAAAHRRQQR